LRLTNEAIIVWTLETKSLLPSPAYRQAGFTKGRNLPLWKRGVRGDFHRMMSLLMDSLRRKLCTSSIVLTSI
jgi:hypothetical protein